MSNQKDTATELALKVINAKDTWEDAKLQRERSNAEYEYAEKQLALARQAFDLVRRRMLPEDAMEFEAASKVGDFDLVLDEVKSVEFVGEPVGRAALSSLRRLGHATVHDLVGQMRARGFQFATDVPARELHAALIKQPWAMKNKRTDEWEYREGE